MFLGIFDIDEYVPISAVTHRFSSGAAYAPTALTYSIYEEGGTTCLDEDVDMTPASPFDSITGCYYSRRQLTEAAGFERDKTYVVVVKATVDSISAIDMHVFQIRAKAAKAGDAMTLTSAYDAAKNAATAGAKMDLIDAPNATAVAAIQSGLATAANQATIISAISEAGGGSGLDAAGVRAAVGLSTANLDTQLSTINSNVDAILVDTSTTIPALINADSGAGAISWTYTLTDSDDGTPIDGAEVWVTTDAAGEDVVASGSTNSFGVVTFMLDAGAYYFWRKCSGYNFNNPDLETVS